MTLQFNTNNHRNQRSAIIYRLYLRAPTFYARNHQQGRFSNYLPVSLQVCSPKKSSMKPLLLFLTLTLMVLTSSCGFDDDDPAPPLVDTRTVIEILQGETEYSTLESALEITGLDISLNTNAVFTVFAPTNDAFTAANINLSTIDTTELENILLYHILSGIGRTRESILEGQLYVTTSNFSSPSGDAVQLFIERAGDDFTLNSSAQLVGTQILGLNGVVHSIDQLLLPPTIGDMIQQNTLLSDFSDLMVASNPLTTGISVLDTLKVGELFTAFAPLNNGFVFDPPVNEDQLRQAMLYHIVGGRATRFNNFPGTLTTLQGDQLLFTGRTVRTTSAQSHTLQFEDIQATNGVLHLVSSVLLPENL